MMTEIETTRRERIRTSWWMTVNWMSYVLKYSLYWEVVKLISMGLNDREIAIGQVMIIGIPLLLMQIIHNGARYMLEGIINESIKKLYEKLIEKMVYYKVDFFVERTEKIKKIWFYLNSVESLLGKLVIDLPEIVMFMIYYIIVIMNISLKLKDMRIYIFPICSMMSMVVTCSLSRKQYYYQKQMSELYYEMKGRVLETMKNIKHVKLNSAERDEIKRMTESYELYDKNRSETRKIGMIMRGISEIIKNIIMLMPVTLTYLYGEMAEKIYMTYMTWKLYGKLLDLREINNYYNWIVPKIKNMEQIINYEEIEKPELKIKSSNELKDNNIIFYNVNFSYDGQKEVLTDVNFTFERGRINLLLGANGSGKSTLMNLLLRLYDLRTEKDRNIIYYKGKNINSMSLKELRQSITFVSKEVTLKEGTVWENITYGCENEEQVEQGCELLNCREWVRKNREVLVGPWGRRILGGDKKKIQLINAISRNTEVIIFDEPTNTLDAEAIKWFITFIKNLKKNYNKTIIIISHDVRLRAHVDKIVNL